MVSGSSLIRFACDLVEVPLAVPVTCSRPAFRPASG
jgi:hypothetical protein